jgi:hypothetical protein
VALRIATVQSHRQPIRHEKELPFNSARAVFSSPDEHGSGGRGAWPTVHFRARDALRDQHLQ